MTRLPRGSMRFVSRELVAETSAHSLHRARERRGGREVMIKIARREGGRSGAEPTVSREADALSALAGAGVVQLVAADESALVLEYVRGPTLAARIERSVLGPSELGQLAEALGAVLDRIHRAGWVYGDLKPENVILRRGRVGEPVLVDFETAVRIGEPYAARVTTEYAAPERLVGAPTADPRSDLFALGAILHAAAEGASPFAAPSRDASVLRVLALEPGRATTAAPELGEKIAALLEKEPARRPASWAALTVEGRGGEGDFGGREAPPASLRSGARGGAPPSHLRLVGPRAEDALLAFVVDAVARRELLLLLEPSERPYGALAASVARLLGVSEGASFRVVEAAARRSLAGAGPGVARDMASVLADVLAGEPDAAARPMLDALRADPALLRARRREAFVELLAAQPAARDVVAAEAAPDAESRAVLDAFLARAPRVRLVFVDGALAASAEEVPAPALAGEVGGLVTRELAVAAVWGEVFDARELAELAGVSSSAAYGAIATGIGSGVLVADPFARGFRFRSSAAREAIAATVSAEERATIAPAIAWLVARRFARDDQRVARAFAAAREPLRAAYYAWRGAARALDASDPTVAAPLVALGDEMLARVAGSVRSLLGAMLDLVRAGVHRFGGDHRAASSAARRALAFLPAGSRAFCEALGERATAAGRIGDPAEVVAVATALRAEPSADATFAWDRACSRTAVQLFYLGRIREAHALVKLFRDRTVDARGRADERRRALSPGCLVTAALYDDRLDEHIARLGAAIRVFESLGDWRSSCLYGSALGFAYGLVGEYARAETILRATLAKSERTAVATALRAVALHNLGEIVGHRRGRVDEGIAIESEAITILREQADNRLLAGSLAYRARMWLAKGDVAAAERDAREATTHAAAFPSLAPWLFATLALVLLEHGSSAEALELAARAAAAPESREVSAATLALAHARALAETGRSREARAVVRRAHAALERRARRISDRRLRAGFLMRVPDHAALVHLAGARKA